MKFKNIGLFLILFYAFLSAKPALIEDYFLFRDINWNQQETLPVDISFCIADLKFDGENLKICEFGEGCHSKFRGFDKLYGKGKAWELFWIYLSQFNLPIWYIGGFFHDQKLKDEISYCVFTACGGRFIDSLNSLQKNKSFLKLVENGDIKNKYSISEYKAIICVKNSGNISKEFRTKYPNVLIWDLATTSYVNNKHKTALLFQDNELLKYRPMSWLIKRRINNHDNIQSVTDQILNDKTVERYVIKPVNGTMGQGILFVEKKDLKKTLEFVLKKSKKNKPKEKDLCYWVMNRDSYCLVEEFVESKTVVANDIPYDPTMRVIFVLCCDNNIPRIDILGAYWKTPPLALNEPGEFIDKHKSHAAKQKFSALPVDPEDYQKVTEIMQQFMPTIYAKMLSI